MKKLFSFSIAMLFMVNPFNAEAVGGCTICHSGTQECHRIILNGDDGKEVHIYHGEAEDCSDDASIQ